MTWLLSHGEHHQVSVAWGSVMIQRRVLGVAVIFIATLIVPGNAAAPVMVIRKTPPTLGIPLIWPAQVLLVDTALRRPTGLAWQNLSDDGGGQLWVSDSDDRFIATVNADRNLPTVVYDVTTRINPGPVAFDQTGNELWVFDLNTSSIIHGFTKHDRTGTATNPYLVPSETQQIPEVSDRPPILGITIDRVTGSRGDDLRVWICRGGGLCSSIEILDPETLEIETRFFPRCEPIDIAIDPDGRRLWILSDNGEGKRPVLLERHLTDASGHRDRRAAAGPTRRFFALASTYRPIAIAASRDAVWVLTDSQGSTLGRATGNSFIFKFLVGPPPVRGVR